MVSVYVGVEASKPDLRRINPDAQLWVDKDGTHIHTSRGILQRQYMRWVGVCVYGNNQSVVQRLPTLGLRFDSSVGQRCLVAQTMNGAHNLTSQGGGSTSGGNGAAVAASAAATRTPSPHASPSTSASASPATEVDSGSSSSANESSSSDGTDASGRAISWEVCPHDGREVKRIGWWPPQRHCTRTDFVFDR